jgi:hypothetical protein
MKKIIVLLALTLAGCSSLYLDTSDLLRDQNKENLKKLSVGQPKELVMDLMGRDPSKAFSCGSTIPTAPKFSRQGQQNL